MDCMAPYGGPVEASIGVGGFLEAGNDAADSDYKLATGIVITYLVNNKLNKSELGPAMEWEKKYVKYLKVF
jgi:Niemann-Pick C1 protein